MLRTLLLATACAAATDVVKRDGCNGFASSCGRAFAQNGTSGSVGPDLQVAATYCFDEMGERNYNTAVDINACLANTFGQLTAGTGCVVFSFLALRLCCLLFPALCSSHAIFVLPL